MELVDTHTHLYTEDFDSDFSDVVARAIGSGVVKLYFPAIDSSYTQAMVTSRDLFPKNIFLMAGLHPCSVNANYKEELDKVSEFMAKNDFAGIGETGLDYHWDKTFIKEQKESLHQHCQWAAESGKPIILHTRDSIDDAIEIIETYRQDGIRGVFHCFSGNIEQAKRIIDNGFYLGIGGVLTFKNSGLDKTIRNIDLGHLVLETDSPYLAPAPYRGKRNESAYIRIIAEKLASIKGCSVDDIASVTTSNANNLYARSPK